mgnify:CR=1 FL=1
MKLKTFPGGVHPHDCKHYSKDSPVKELPLLQKVIIPLSQHVGAPSTPVVKVGDEVKSGQLIAEAAGYVSIPQHSSITGKVTKIDIFPHPTGTSQTAIEITANGQDEWVELTDTKDFLSLSVEEMKSRIRNAGICGMGGAGFPTIVKLSPPADKPIDTLILNGVECEPYLTADHRLMLERGEDIIQGMKIMMKILGAKQGFIGIEANKPDAIDLLSKLTQQEKNIQVVALKLRYPQGAEKQLIYAVTGRKVPNRGGLPMDVKVVVQNVGTAVAVYEAVRFQKPLIDRIITVTGSVVTKPSNLKARIGTPFSVLVEACGGTSGEIGKIISGGPMMGCAIPDLNAPVAKGTSGLVLFSTQEAHFQEEHTCLRCGRCVDVCPMNLFPSLIAQAVKKEDLKTADHAGMTDCIKCGSCAYVCPAHIRLVQWIDTGKIKLAEQQRAAK